MRNLPHKKQYSKNSWEPVSRWYDHIVGKKGHYYHQKVIIPNVIRIVGSSNSRLLDLACGQGVLARHLGEQVDYTGVDISPSLIKRARQQSHKQRFIIGDASAPLPLNPNSFDWVTCILAIQDIEHADAMIAHAAKYLRHSGKMVVVMNHPCFRIPRATSWQEDAGTRYRRVNGYMTPRTIPIRSTPSQGDRSPAVMSYHRPLSDYFHWLAEAGFVVTQLEEWVSDKQSSGSKARMENRARKEFPLFLCLVATVKNL